jgi:hypothetical protein
MGLWLGGGWPLWRLVLPEVCCGSLSSLSLVSLSLWLFRSRGGVLGLLAAVWLPGGWLLRPWLGGCVWRVRPCCWRRWVPRCRAAGPARAGRPPGAGRPVVVLVSPAWCGVAVPGGSPLRVRVGALPVRVLARLGAWPLACVCPCGWGCLAPPALLSPEVCCGSCLSCPLLSPLRCVCRLLLRRAVLGLCPPWPLWRGRGVGRPLRLLPLGGSVRCPRGARCWPLGGGAPGLPWRLVCVLPGGLAVLSAAGWRWRRLAGGRWPARPGGRPRFRWPAPLGGGGLLRSRRVLLLLLRPSVSLLRRPALVGWGGACAPGPSSGDLGAVPLWRAWPGAGLVWRGVALAVVRLVWGLRSCAGSVSLVFGAAPWSPARPCSVVVCTILNSC